MSTVPNHAQRDTQQPRAVIVAAHARALAGDYRANMQLARLIVGAENDGLDVVALVDTADWRTAHAMVGNDEADVILGADGGYLQIPTELTSDNTAARQRRPRPVR